MVLRKEQEGVPSPRLLRVGHAVFGHPSTPNLLRILVRSLRSLVAVFVCRICTFVWMRFDLPEYAPSKMGLHWFLYDFWINEESNRILMRVLRWCNYCGILLVFRNEICLRETKAAHAPSECWEGCEEFSLCRPVRVYPGTYVVFSTAVCVFRSQFLFEEKCRTLVASWPARYVALEFVHHCYF